MESYNRKVFSEAAGRDVDFVQDNHSLSKKGVLRGLHYQLPPNAQGKLVRAVVGEIFDVAVDIRRGSPTFGRWVGERLSAENRRQLWIPEGFAHGFLTLSERAEVLYKATAYYAPGSERSLVWNDPAVAVEWPPGPPLLSPKDEDAPVLEAAELFRLAQPRKAAAGVSISRHATYNVLGAMVPLAITVATIPLYSPWSATDARSPRICWAVLASPLPRSGSVRPSRRRSPSPARDRRRTGRACSGRRFG